MDTRFLCSLWCRVCVVFIILIGPEARDNNSNNNGCDPEFKAKVEQCLRRLQGFPVLAMNKTFVAGDWHKTDIICRRQLVDSASHCVREEYGRCPQSHSWRSLCGFQNVHPDLLLRYGHVVCKHREVLKQHWECQQSQHCSLKSCLDRYDPSLPSRLTVGMLKSPLSLPYCSYQAYAEYCHEMTIVPVCPREFYDAQQEIITSTRPLNSCSVEEIQRLKTRYRESEISFDAIHNAASDWSLGAVRTSWIVGWVWVVVVYGGGGGGGAWRFGAEVGSV